MDALFKVELSDSIDKRTKNRITAKMKGLSECVQKIEDASGIKYPFYYVEPLLTLVPSTGSFTDDFGVLYARTIPLESDGRMAVIVQLSAPLVLYANKSTLKLVLAHEFLHYIELVKRFSSMNIVSQITSSSVFEETYTDAERTVDPSLVFKDKKFVRDLLRKTSAGLNDPKLNEKCNLKWISKGLPTQKISIGNNQARISVESIIQSKFDPKVLRLFEKGRVLKHNSMAG